MTPIEKIKIPPIEPGTRRAVRTCPECKARIEFPLELFNKLLECPFCHKGVLFRRRLDQAKQTAGCLGGCLGLLVVFAVLTLASTYMERPPWIYGWSPIVTPKSNAPPNAVSFAEQAVAAVAAERKAVADQRELLEKMVATFPEQNPQARQQIRNLQSREDELARKQRELEDILTDLRQKARQSRN